MYASCQVNLSNLVNKAYNVLSPVLIPQTALKFIVQNIANLTVDNMKRHKMPSVPPLKMLFQWQ
jgi:hypothetical protein